MECNAVWFEGGSGDRCPLDSHRDRERPTPPSAVLQGNDHWCKACRCINASLHLHEAAAISGPPTTPRDTHLSFPENLWSLCFWRILLRLTTIANQTFLVLCYTLSYSILGITEANSDPFHQPIFNCSWFLKKNKSNNRCERCLNENAS